MHGRHRRCASQQGYAVYYLLKLGLEHERVHDLVERLLHWRWPDGGWNCDKDPKLGADFVDWGGTSSKRMNPWVTLDALSVLKQAGRHAR
jgi:hypothetical protein